MSTTTVRLWIVRVARWVGTAVLLILLAFSLWLLVNAMAATGGTEEIAASRTSLIQFLTLCALLGAVFMTIRTIQTSRLAIREQAFGRAVESLGRDDNQAARIGGVHSLLFIARGDSSYWPLIERVLAAYVRERATSSAVVSADVQDAFMVLGQRTNRSWSTSGQTIDLAGVKLRGVILNGANLVQCNFDDADLTDSRLTDVKLMGSSFRRAEISHCSFRKSDLRAVSIEGATVDGATDFNEAVVRNLILTEKQLEKLEDLTPIQHKYITIVPEV